MRLDVGIEGYSIDGGKRSRVRGLHRAGCAGKSAHADLRNPMICICCYWLPIVAAWGVERHIHRSNGLQDLELIYRLQFCVLSLVIERL